MKVKPFADQGHYTQVHNALLDAVMPKLSPNAWKILSLVVRQTVGWHRKQHGLSYSAIKKGTGIVSDATVSKCLKELTDGDNKKRLLDAIPGEDKWTGTSYALNRKVEIDWTPTEYFSTTENEAEPTTENEVDPASKTEVPPTTENEALIQKEESSFKKKRKQSSAAGAAGRPWTDPFCSIFLEAFQARWGMPYQLNRTEKGRDFQAFKTARETYDELFNLESWTIAVKNYFASPPKPNHKIHHLIDNYPVFLRSAKDQWGNLIEEQSNDKGKQSDPNKTSSGAGAGASSSGTQGPQWRNNRVKLG